MVHACSSTGKMKKLTHAVSTRPAGTTLSTVFSINKEIILGSPCPIITALTVLENTAT